MSDSSNEIDSTRGTGRASIVCKTVEIRDGRRAGFFPGSGPGSFLPPGFGYPDENPEFFIFFYLKVKKGSQSAKLERLTKFSSNETIWQFSLNFKL